VQNIAIIGGTLVFMFAFATACDSPRLCGLNPQDGLQRRHAALFTVILAAADVIGDITLASVLHTDSYTQPAVSSHLRLLYACFVSMVSTLVAKMLTNGCLFYRFLRDEAAANVMFAAWLRTTNTAVALTFICAMADFDCTQLLSCRVGGATIFSAPLSLDAENALIRTGGVQICLEKLPQLLVSILLMAETETTMSQDVLNGARLVMSLTILSVLFSGSKRIISHVYLESARERKPKWPSLAPDMVTVNPLLIDNSGAALSSHQMLKLPDKSEQYELDCRDIDVSEPGADVGISSSERLDFPA
jgi:hypothetical protein